MIGEQEINEALMRVGQMEAFGPPASKYMEQQGYDPESIFETANEHAATMVAAGILPVSQIENCSVSFAMGFALALVLNQIEKEKNA